MRFSNFIIIIIIISSSSSNSSSSFVVAVAAVHNVLDAIKVSSDSSVTAQNKCCIIKLVSNKKASK